MKNKKWLIISCIFLLLIVIFFFARIIAIRLFADSEEKHYTNLEYVGLSKGVIHFECTKDYESSDGKEIDQYVFTPKECLEIKKDFESHFGPLLWPYDIEVRIYGDRTGVDENGEYYLYSDKDGTVITFKDFSITKYKTVVIDTSKQERSCSQFNDYLGFKKIEIYGALFPALNSEEYKNMDISFIQHICDEGEIVTDQHTYDEYVGYYVDGKFIDKFGDLLSSGANVKVLEDDQRDYK